MPNALFLGKVYPRSKGSTLSENTPAYDKMQKLGISFFWLGKKRNCRIWHLIVIKIVLKRNKWKWSKPGENCSSLQYVSSSHCPQVRSSSVLIPPLVGVSSGAPRQTDVFLFVQIFRYQSAWNVASEESRHSPQKRLIQTICFLLLTPSMSVSQHVPRESTQKKRVSSPSCVCCQCPLFVPLPVINLVFIAWENGRVVWERMKSLPVNVWTPCSIMMTHNNNRSLSVKQKKKKIGLSNSSVNCLGGGLWIKMVVCISIIMPLHWR